MKPFLFLLLTTGTLLGRSVVVTPHRYLVTLPADYLYDNLIVQGSNSTARFGGWSFGTTGGGANNSTNAPEGFYMVQNGTSEFISCMITGLTAGATYKLKISIDARSSGMNGGLRIVAGGDTGNQLAGPAGAIINFPVGAAAIGTFYTNVVVTNTVGPHKFVMKHATSPDGDWFRITEIVLYSIPTRTINLGLMGDRTTGYSLFSATNIDKAVTNATDAISWLVTQGDMADVSNTNYATLNGAMKAVIEARGGHWWSAVGNHDYDVNIANFTGYFGVSTYYKKTVGLIDFFFIDSNPANSAATRGSVAAFQGSTMGKWLISSVQQSTNRWKIVDFHHPAWSSSSQHTNEPDLRWDWKSLGVDAVLQAHDHNVERLNRDILVMTIGLGGSSGGAFGAARSDSMFRSLADGWTKVYDSFNCLVFESYNTNNVLLDRFTIKKR